MPSSKNNKLNIIKLANSPLLNEYLKEINALAIPYNLSRIITRDNYGIIKNINHEAYLRMYILENIYLKLMDIQEKYKIPYTFVCTIYDRAVFDKIAISKYINIFQLTIPTNILVKQKDIRFIYNENIKHLKLLLHVGSDIIMDIISNIKIKSLYIRELSLDAFYKIFQVLPDSKLHSLQITAIKIKLSQYQTNNISQPVVKIINNSHIKLKTLMLPLSYIPNFIIDAILENIIL